MTQDNPHNEMPKDTVEELLEDGMCDHYGDPSKRIEEILELIEKQRTTAYNKGVEVGRVEERKIMKLRIDYDRRKGTPLEETVQDIYDSIELKDTPLPDDKL